MKYNALQLCRCVWCVLLMLGFAIQVPAQNIAGEGNDNTFAVDTIKTTSKKQKKKSALNSEQTLGEVVVTSERRQTSINSVSSKLSANMIDRSMGKTLASLLEHVSGVSSIQTGTTVAKPVINGMYGNRILIVNNGARQTGQQWGADHAPEIDQNSSGSIEVVKGAESVRYGSEALGGIIVMEQKILPYQQKEITGHTRALYGTNGRRFSFVGQAEGTIPFDRNFAWRLQGTIENTTPLHRSAIVEVN